MSDKLVYVAGPYSHPDPIVNVREAVYVAERLMGAPGVTALVPHLSMLWHLVLPKPIEWWYQYDLRLLERCDAVFRFDGDSVGADREVAHAETLGLPVFTSMADFEDWADA